MSKSRFVLAAFILTLCFTPKIVASGWSVDIESGAAFNGYNDVRIPGNTGTAISLTEDLDADAAAFIRVRLTKSLGERHRLSVLVAPLRITASGRVDREVAFNGALFAANEPLTSHYRFDSYRLSWSYAVYKSERLRVDLGLTGKIRDASIEIESANKISEKSNTGFVPLINFAFDWQLGSGLGLVLKGDVKGDGYLAPLDGPPDADYRGVDSKPPGYPDNDWIFSINSIRWSPVPFRAGRRADRAVPYGNDSIIDGETEQLFLLEMGMEFHFAAGRADRAVPQQQPHLGDCHVGNADVADQPGFEQPFHLAPGFHEILMDIGF